MRQADLTLTFRVEQLFDDNELRTMIRYYLEGRSDFPRWCADSIITPALSRIQNTVGKQVDALYLAYMLQHILDERVRGEGR